MEQDAKDTQLRSRSLGQQVSLHGEQAALRRAIGELIFFAGVNDIERCQKIVSAWNIKLGDSSCADYDRRTPLHIAAAEGAYTVCGWLLDNGADANALDRFNRTPLEDAVRSNFAEICQLLCDGGAKIYQDGHLQPLHESKLNGIVNLRRVAGLEFGIEPEWEINPAELTVLNKLGEGEFGEVFKARYHGTYVAVKQLKSSDQIALGDFRTEMAVLRKLHHPNAVQFLGACTKQQPYLIVTELMSCSLASAFTMVFALTVRRQVEVALEFARAMAYMHSRQPVIIHRDLKPANIMVGGSSFMLSETHTLLNWNGTIKVADFGLSKSLPKMGIPATASAEHLEGTYRLTGETGSYRYMAPEVFLHEPYNSKVDVYSFAMICYQLFEGRLPYEGVDPIQAARNAAMHRMRPTLVPLQPSPVKEVREALRKLVEQCWDHDPNQRPAFDDIAAQLEALLEKCGPRKQPKMGSSAQQGSACCSVM